MNILLKTTLKNIVGKPFRSALVIFSIFICSIAALLSFDLMQVEQDSVLDMLSQVMGKADIVLSGQGADDRLLPEGFPEHDILSVRSFNDSVYENVPGEYFVATSSRVDISGLDLEAAVRMGMISDGLDLGDNEAIVTMSFASLYGCEEGDTVTVHDVRGNPVDIVVRHIVPTQPMHMILRGNAVVVNDNTADVLSCGQNIRKMYYFSINDPARVMEASDMLELTFPNANVLSFAGSMGNDSQMQETLGMMMLMFAVAFLLVVFITASICERIVSERMSFVGTLRSLGLSARATGMILLLENVVYALLGSVPAVILYILVRIPLYNSMFSFTTSEGALIEFKAPPLSILLVIGVVVGAIVVECIIPLKAQLRALRTSIRDIIFDNRDTDYKFSKFGLILGSILSVTAVITFFFRTNIFGAAACLVTGVFGLSFLFPRILRVITNFLKKTASKADHEKWALASVEAGTRKSAVGSGVLCVTSTAMCMIVFTVAASMIGAYSATVYDCDVIAETNRSMDYYSYVEHLDGVTDTEFIYASGTQTISINDVHENFDFYALPEGGYRMYNAFSDLPDSLEDGSIMLLNSWAQRNGINAGDTVRVVYNYYGVFPIEKEYVVAGLFKNIESNSTTNSIIMSMNDFRSIFHDKPGMVLLRSSNPDATADAMNTYGVGSYGSVRTIDQVMQEERNQNNTTLNIFAAIIAIAVSMTCIGVISNQLIGFEGRKKECAVMLSTAMSRKTLTGVLFREMIITSVTSTLLGTCIGSIMVYVIKSALDSSDSLYIPINYNFGLIALMWVAMTLLFVLTVLFPVRNLKKMKISEQIKYE